MGDIRDFIHSPPDLAKSTLKWAEQMRNDPGISLGVPCLDRQVVPFRPGDLITVLGRPGNGKSSFLCWLARQEARRLKEKQCVVFVTWETTAEVLDITMQVTKGVSVADVAWGRANMELLKLMSIKRGSLPIWIIGHGVGGTDKKLPRLTPRKVFEAIGSIREDYNIEPTMVLIDYIQIVPIEGYNSNDRVQIVTEIPYRLKELAMRLGVAVVAAAQAHRRVDDRKIKLPEMQDALWASSIEQASDKIFSLWLPTTTEDPGAVIKIGGKDYPVTPTLFFLKLLKQKKYKGRFTWPLYFSIEDLRLAALESDVENLPF